MVRASGVVLVAALGVAALPGVVAADEYDDDEYDDEEPGPTGTRVEAAVGLMFGSIGADDYVGDATGGAIDLGIRRRRWLGYGEYGLYHHHGKLADMSISGLLHRASANARYDLEQLWFDRHAVLSAWAEVGIGYQLIRWEAGGTLGRPDASIGIGGGIQVGKENHRIGIGYAIRLIATPAPERKGEPLQCAGPCYEPTGPLGLDVGGLLVILFPFEV
jgi:hypothetical protein